MSKHKLRYCGRKIKCCVLFLNPLKHPAVEKFAHAFAMDEVHGKAQFDGADFVQLRDLFGVQLPIEALQVVFDIVKICARQ